MPASTSTSTSTSSPPPRGHYAPQFKVVLIGDAGVGKTTFLNGIKTGEFETKYAPTTGTEIHPIIFNTNHGPIRFNVWDTAGQEKYWGIRLESYIGAQGAIIMFDVNSRSTYENVANWYRELDMIAKEIPVVLVGNKKDLPKVRAWPPDFDTTKYLMEVDISTKFLDNNKMPFLLLARKFFRDDDLTFHFFPPPQPPEAAVDGTTEAGVARAAADLPLRGEEPIPRFSATAADSEGLQNILHEYMWGRRPVGDIVQFAKSYMGPAPQLRWDSQEGIDTKRTNVCFARNCVHVLSDDMLCELFQAFVDDDPDPDFLLTRDQLLGTFFHLALDRGDATSRGRLLLLLVSQGMTRIEAPDSNLTPLHKACAVRGIDDVIHRLIDLDPGVLTLPGGPTSGVPLHDAFAGDQPLSLSVIRRMIEAKPEAILCRDRYGQTPGGAFLARGRPNALLAEPQSLVNDHTAALYCACENVREFEGLIKGIADSFPPALVVGCRPPSNQLLFENVLLRQNQEAAELIKEWTLHVTLAVVEYALACPVLSEDDDGDVAQFQRHVQETVLPFLPSEGEASPSPGGTGQGPQPMAGSGFAVARSLLKLPNNVEVVRALFHHEQTAEMLRTDRALRDAVLGETVQGLFRMNRLGRLSADLSSVLQIKLLDGDKDNVESIYLHFREVGPDFLRLSGKPTSEGVADVRGT